MTPLVALQMLFYLLGGFGLFFMDIGLPWFVSVHKGCFAWRLWHPCVPEGYPSVIEVMPTSAVVPFERESA